MNESQLKALRSLAEKKAGEPCALCGKPSLFMGCFIPNEPWEYSSLPPTPDATRSFLYVACGEHMNEQDLRRIEDLIVEASKTRIPHIRVRSNGSIERQDV